MQEVILATNPSMEGDATAMYLRAQISALGVRVTRLARGLPVGRRPGICRPEHAVARPGWSPGTELGQ